MQFEHSALNLVAREHASVSDSKTGMEHQQNQRSKFNIVYRRRVRTSFENLRDLVVGERQDRRVSGWIKENSARAIRPPKVINQVYDPETGLCIANTAPLACEISVNGPFDNMLPRNAFRQPGTFYQNTAVMKNFALPKEGMQIQFRGELYDVFNHPNLYVNPGTPDVSSLSFAPSTQTQVPGVTASYKDSRQIVLAVKFLF